MCIRDSSKAKCIALERQVQIDSSRMASALAASSSMSSAQRKSQLGSVSPLLSAAAAGGFDAPFISISSPHVTVVPKHTQTDPVSYTHLRAHETPEHLVCRLLLEKKKHNNNSPLSNLFNIKPIHFHSYENTM
eukprot:TRINITY_DN27525_c0_g1_i3.p1 TRINITY_DN27525_c0_g1~~TRINITY_DN27525_c0_g1_i3.p1  ORF type:complete len:133 (+),score=21.19 TRINITY_DN27525_c0_g1_i3:119-517(+)